MIGKIKYKLNKEDGAVQIVEATFVFPIMFIILFFLMYMGNAHYIRAQIESIVVERAIAGANYCTDPILQTIKEEKKIPKLSEMDLDPYRYFSGMNEIEKKISRDVEAAIESTTVSMFRNMKPVVKTPKSEIAKYNNHILYSLVCIIYCYVEFARLIYSVTVVGKICVIIGKIDGRERTSAHIDRSACIVGCAYEGTVDFVRGFV